MNISATQRTVADYYSLVAATREGNQSPRQSGLSPENATASRQAGPGSEAAKENRNSKQFQLQRFGLITPPPKSPQRKSTISATKQTSAT